MEEGLWAADEVILDPSSNWERINQTLGNIGFYLRPIPRVKKIPIDFQAPKHYYCSSPFLIRKNDRYYLNIRCVNYRITKEGGYVMNDPYNLVRTRNFLLTLSNSFDVINTTELIDKTGMLKYPRIIIGLEDLRLFGDNQFFGICCETSKENIITVHYGRYDDNGIIYKIIPLKVGENFQLEKNWLPLIKDDKIFFIYSYDPLRVYQLEEDGTITKIFEKKFPKYNFGTFRGSSPPIPYNDGYLLTIHQVFYNNPRKYIHRFVWLNQEFTELRYSKPFYFEHFEIEYNISICHTLEGLAMTYSFRDNSANLIIVSYQTVEEFFNY
jgi:hypothetical protein